MTQPTSRKEEGKDKGHQPALLTSRPRLCQEQERLTQPEAEFLGGLLPRFMGWSALLYHVELTGLTSELGIL